ncbi:winged helix-turn-helix domain-containing protein [Devosia sp.]|uniref:winged helix-turn-helix domain-containing tetratricopeptide repeat protein n=1 Tax=Devosia sp. TaxID=1871048 RepID=UPI0025C6E1D7|nr:winged helix-turn-helix domain-containing protein [Devosia sp.]
MSDQRITCGPFAVDLVAKLATRNGEPLPIGHRGVALLASLFGRPGEVLTKTELLDAAWGSAAIEESNLSVQVAALRKVLGPSPTGGEWIVTVPRVGYRFASPAIPSPANSERSSVAVLPFVNLSSDPEQAFFADGLAEEIIVALGRLPGLLVIARNSSFAYRGSDVDVRKVGSDLDVRYVLSGSVRRGGNRVRMSAQLADAGSGAHLWAETFDRELADVFAIQDEVTRRIVDALKLKLTPAQTAGATDGGTNDIAALDLLMRGRAILNGPTQNLEVHRRTIDLIGRAIKRDPSYVDAIGELAIAYHVDYLNRWTEDPDGSLREAQRLGDRMVELAPNHQFGHFVVALTAMVARDFDRFRREAAITVALNPDAGIASDLQGHLSLANEVPLEAIPHFERCMRLDPSLSATILYLQFLGRAYFYGGRYETAVAVFRERILLMPDTDASRGYLAAALGHLGKVEEARQVWSELMAINPGYVMAERLNRTAVQPRQIEMVLAGARKAGLTV